MGFPDGSVGKESTGNAGDTGDSGSRPGLGRSPGGGHGNTLQYSCWRIPWTEEPVGYSPQGCKELDITEATVHSRTIKS